jgi:hypothetical protein
MQEHPFTLHHTYTGEGCAMCGKQADAHKADYRLIDGERLDDATVCERICRYCNKMFTGTAFAICNECGRFQ